MFESDVLEGDVAIVTGAGRNIGEQIACLFANHGANVVVADIDEQRAESTKKEIEQENGNAITSIVDISNESEVIQLVETTMSEFGKVDVLINNASIMDTTGIYDLTVEEFDSVVSVNLRGTFLCTREVAKEMRETGNGRIVNLSSTSGKKGRKNSIAYSTTKAGMLNFTRSAAKALSEYDIRVNTLTPTRTGLRTLGSDYEERSHEPETDASISNKILTNRLGEPKDIASTALFLVSPASEFINGTEILVDGGRSA